MIKDYKIVTLCGSTRFKEQFIETQKKLTLDGCIVISVGLFGQTDFNWHYQTNFKRQFLNNLKKIPHSDCFSYLCNDSQGIKS